MEPPQIPLDDRIAGVGPNDERVYDLKSRLVVKWQPWGCQLTRPHTVPNCESAANKKLNPGRNRQKLEAQN